MAKFIKMRELLAGTDIRGAFEKAFDLVHEFEDVGIEFNFNGITLQVEKDKVNGINISQYFPTKIGDAVDIYHKVFFRAEEEIANAQKLKEAVQIIKNNRNEFQDKVKRDLDSRGDHCASLYAGLVFNAMERVALQ